jgi:predicted P-loop ATPase
MSKSDRVANHLNLRFELQSNPLTKGLVAFNEFACAVILLRPIPRPNLPAPKDFMPRPWIDSDDTALSEHFNAAGFTNIRAGVVRAVIELEARANSFHPVRNYFNALRWDSVPRLSNLLIEHCGAVITGDDDAERAKSLAYIQAITRDFFIGAVARTFRPGAKVDTMPVFEGKEGILKSLFLRTIAIREEWFSDSLPHNLASKDAREHLPGRLIIEMPEVSQFHASRVETVKAFLSCQVDKFRPSFGRAVISVPRCCVFAGTTNSTTYLHDVTGNRRFQPVTLGKIKLATIRQIVDQVWAEAVTAFKSGETWWLSTELEKFAAEEQAARLQLDPWYEPIAKYIETRSIVTMDEILGHLGLDQSRRDKSHEMRVGNVFRLLRWERKRKRGSDGQRHYYYEKSAKPEPETKSESESETETESGLDRDDYPDGWL